MMKKTADILLITAAVFAVYLLILTLLGEPGITINNIRITNGHGLILSIFLVMLSLFIRLYNNSEYDSFSPGTRLLLQLSLTVSIGLLAFLTLHYNSITGDENVISRFKKIYYYNKPYDRSYLGIPSLQYPADNWIMQEIIFQVKPDYIIETGTFSGGTTLFYAHLLEKVNKRGKIITIDVQDLVKKARGFDAWKRMVQFYQSDSTAEGLVRMIAVLVKGKKVLVTLDSNHSKKHVLKELKLYSPLVSAGSYIIVQDTHLGGHPNSHYSVKGEGPWEAVEEFMKTSEDFKIDYTWERNLITQNPSGYLKRVR